MLTGINIRHHNLSALLCEQLCCFSANALAGTGDDGDLAHQHALGEVQVASDLAYAVGVRHCYERRSPRTMINLWTSGLANAKIRTGVF